MNTRASSRPQARRSDFTEGRRSASSAPAAVHLALLPVLILFLAVSYHAATQVAAPLMRELASSWQEEAETPAQAIGQTDDLAAFTPEVRRWSHHIQTWAASADLPPTLVATVIQIESCGDPLAHSSAGALGLFQVMPYHFEPDQDPLLVEVNARAGLDYLARSYQLARGTIDRTLAGYNGGHGVIQQPEADWPAETQRYAAWGSGILSDIERGELPSPTLSNWLAAGGHSLCQQAALRSMAAR